MASTASKIKLWAVSLLFISIFSFLLLFRSFNLLLQLLFQVLNYEEMDASESRVEKESDVSTFSSTNSEESSKPVDSHFEVGQLKEINLQLYQHAVKRIMQNGTK